MTEKIFDYWDSIPALAKYFGQKYATAQSWVFRGYIPVAQDALRLEKAANVSGEPLTMARSAALMAKWAQQRTDARAQKSAK